MPIDFIDKSGEPRSKEELQEALEVINKEFLSKNFGNPGLFVQLPVIRDALKLLIMLYERQEEVASLTRSRQDT